MVLLAIPLPVMSQGLPQSLMSQGISLMSPHLWVKTEVTGLPQLLESQGIFQCQSPALVSLTIVTSWYNKRATTFSLAKVKNAICRIGIFFFTL